MHQYTHVHYSSVHGGTKNSQMTNMRQKMPNIYTVCQQNNYKNWSALGKVVNTAFSALLLVGWQEGHPACKN